MWETVIMNDFLFLDQKVVLINFRAIGNRFLMTLRKFVVKKLYIYICIYKQQKNILCSITKILLFLYFTCNTKNPRVWYHTLSCFTEFATVII